MFSRGSRKLTPYLVAAAMLGAFAGTASAQSYLNGHFTLPNDVRWQGTILAAGDYAITMSSSQGPALVRQANGVGALFVLAKIVKPAEKGQPTGLLITRRGSERVVRSFNWRERGITFVYVPLTHEERETLARADEREAVPIRTASR